MCIYAYLLTHFVRTHQNFYKMDLKIAAISWCSGGGEVLMLPGSMTGPIITANYCIHILSTAKCHCFLLLQDLCKT